MADSQENKQKEQNDVSEKKFMIEKIKERPVNKKKLLRSTLIRSSVGMRLPLPTLTRIASFFMEYSRS